MLCLSRTIPDYERYFVSQPFSGPSTGGPRRVHSAREVAATRPQADPPPDSRSIGCLPQLLRSTSLVMKDAVVFQCEQPVGDFLRLSLIAGYGEELRRDEID